MSNQLTHDNFDHFYLSDGMLQTLKTVGYGVPTPVQASSIPLVMAGIDLIVQSQTGTGKTAAFAIPITEMLSHNPGTIEVLVLAPTRELAKQVSDEFARFCAFKNIAVATVYGGTGYEAQQKALETAQVVVATPGRLLDLANRGHADLSNLRIFGLDEADEMLSMGFAEEVDAIIAMLPEERQSLLFSATITEDVKALGKSMLYYPEFVTLSTDTVAQEDVTHEFFRVSGVGRQRDLLRVIEYEEPENAIIFANTRGDTFAVTRFLKRHGLRAEVLNGDLPQKERERTLKALRNGEIDFLVATDVAARGIDISELSHVINYVVPESAEVYVHRTGRTGRAGSQGTALSLISPREMSTLFNIRKLYQVEVTERTLPSPAEVLAAKRQRRLEALDTTLDASSVRYGGALGLARQVIDRGDDGDNLKLVARLIALAQQASAGTLDDVDLRATVAPEAEASSPTPDVEAVEVESEDVEVADVETETAQAAADVDEDAIEADGDVEATDDGSSSRSRRSRRRGGDDKPERSASTDSESKARTARESNDEESQDKPRRRRRRRDSDGEKSDEKVAKSDDKSAKRDDKSAKRDDKSAKRDDKSAKRDDKLGEKKSASSREERSDDSNERRSRRGDRSRSKDRSRGRDRDRSRDKKRSGKSDRAPEREAAPERKPKVVAPTMSKIWVNVGREQFETPEQVVEMVCFMAGMDPDDLGGVTFENSYSYVEVRDDYFYDIITAMNNQDWNGFTVSAEPARK